MSDTAELSRDLDRLLTALESVQAKNEAPVAPAPADAIVVELARPTRTTAVVSLREAPEIEAFRNELVDGIVRADTVNRLLRLLDEVILRLLQ